MILSNRSWSVILDHVQRSTDSLLGIAEGSIQDGTANQESAEGDSQADQGGGNSQRDILIHPRREMQIDKDV